MPFKIPISICNLNMCQLFSFHGDCTIRDGEGLQESSSQSATEMSTSESAHILLFFFFFYLLAALFYLHNLVLFIFHNQRPAGAELQCGLQHSGFPPRVPTQGRFQAQTHNHRYMISHTYKHTHMLPDCKAPKVCF